MKTIEKKIPVLKRILLFLLFVVVYSCVFLDSKEYPETVTAGEMATFKMDIHVQPVGGAANGEKLIIALLVPNSWETETESVVTYTSSVDEGTQSMSVVPDNVLPVNGGGLTWGAHLKNRLGVGPNVLSDMKWVTFQSDKSYNIGGGEYVSASVTINTLVAEDNLRAKIGFFVNHSSDGLSTNPDNWKVQYSDCIDVLDGEGLVTDYCELQFNVVQPINATKNDFLTFSFQGDIAPNPLIEAQEVYLCAKAITDTGAEYEVCGMEAKAQMTKASAFSNSYALTLWPGQYFNIPANETLVRIEYSFTNEDGTVVIQDDTEPYAYVPKCN